MAKLMLVGGGERELPDDLRQTERGVEWTDGEDVTPQMHHTVPWTAILELVMAYHEPQVAFA
jgi:hypothetical protein